MPASDAADILQRSITVFWRRVQREPTHGRWAVSRWSAGFLYGIIRKEWWRQRETAQRDRARVHSLDAEPGALAVDDESHADAAEMKSKLDHCLDGLDPVDRRLVRLRFFEGATVAAIGAAVGLDKSNVSRRLARVLVRLRRCMEQGR